MDKTQPYYAVIFSSKRSQEDEQTYLTVAKRMAALASEQEGFIGMENVQDEHGVGIMISYWNSLEAIEGWNKQSAHSMVQKKGRESWYDQFTVRVCKVERMYDFSKAN
ncbi:MAG TPA: antibiotic biosynthesis monooxygenase [Sporolactobacillaceae bacterium]|nr:antibiotic biosynthesis monooxygenase [Sporolactobacillaceae bacterium]